MDRETLWARVRGGKAWIMAGAALLAILLLLMTNRVGGAERSGRTALEARLEAILTEIRGGERVRAMVSEDGDGAVGGAVIVAPGLDDIRTALSLQRAAVTLLGVEAERVSVVGAGVEL